MAYKKVRELEDKIVEKPKGHEIIVLYPGINLLFNLLDGKIKEHWGYDILCPGSIASERSVEEWQRR